MSSYKLSKPSCRRRAFSLLVCIWLAQWQAAAARQTSEPMDEALRLYKARQFTPTLRLCQDMLEKKPGDASVHYLRGNSLLALERLSEAAHEYALVEHYAPGSLLAKYAKQTRERIELTLSGQSIAKTSRPADSNESDAEQDGSVEEDEPPAGSA